MTAASTKKAASRTSEAIFSGLWQSERGSRMDLTVTGNTVQGRFVTAVGAPRRDQAFNLTGFVNGDLISFSVDFEQYRTLTAWTGQHAPDGKGDVALRTNYLTVLDLDEDYEADLQWGNARTGTDVFRRVT